MDKKKKLGNKGFSLVELIIVIAIMVLLVGLLAPQYIKYLDKSRIAADTQLADNIRQALTTTLLDPNITSGMPAYPTPEEKIKDGSTDAKEYWKNVYGILGVDSQTGPDTLIKKLKYDSTTTNADAAKIVSITYAVDNEGNITVRISGGKYGAVDDTAATKNIIIK